MAAPQTREELIQYCLRSLGAPVIEINVEQQQLEDRLDEAIQFWQEYHADATTKAYIKHEVTQEDIDSSSIPVGDDVIAIIRILAIEDFGGVFGAKHQTMSDLFLRSRSTAGMSGSSFVTMQMARQYWDVIDDVLNSYGERISFERHTGKIKFHVPLEGRVSVGSSIMIECYTTLRPTDYPKIYNDMSLKELATSYIKKQWGQNLIKFEGMQLPGGITINGRQTYDDAVQEIEKIKESFSMNYEMPLDFFVG